MGHAISGGHTASGWYDFGVLGLLQGLAVTIRLGLIVLGNSFYSKTWLASGLLEGGQFHWRVTTAESCSSLSLTHDNSSYLPAGLCCVLNLMEWSL